MSATKNITDYFKEYNLIKNTTETKDVEQFKRIKIAVLSSSTIKGLNEILFVKCYELGIIPEIFIGEYNQYNQEILDDNSKLYRFKPDLIILFIDTQSLLGDMFFDYYSLSEENKDNLMKNKIIQIKLLMNKISRNLNCKIVLHNFEVPINSPLGIIDNKQRLGFIEFVKNINSKISGYFKENNQIFIFDYDLFCSKWGKKNIIDYKMYYFGDIKINFEYLPKLCEEYIAYIKPLMSLTKKCIVLDLDNTLWGGIIGEDGLEGIKLGPTSEGRPFLEFQKYILSLFNRGIILAINSKNNPEDALNVLKNHPYMILKEKHFASIKINWNDKISNMKAIAKEINIGLDSLVFFDDDKLNREMIKTALPNVKVVNLPEDSSLYLKTLMELDDFNSFYFSEEDKKKGKMYADQRKRQELSKTTTDITKYLKALEMIVTIEKATSFTIPRISQLTQKTNQFNMTTKRYMEEDVKKNSDNKDFLVFSIKLEDKFGDNGITGVAIVEKKNKVWVIDSFLLSCRIIGRQVEETMLAYIIEEAKKENVKTLIGEFITTKKNIPAKDFYKKNGFKLIEKTNELQKWQYKTNQKYNYPKFIKVIK
ncbi:MAG: HAD-IIIC family phosphatase [Nanoarchaeota archaeon]